MTAIPSPMSGDKVEWKVIDVSQPGADLIVQTYLNEGWIITQHVTPLACLCRVAKNPLMS